MRISDTVLPEYTNSTDILHVSFTIIYLFIIIVNLFIYFLCSFLLHSLF